MPTIEQEIANDSRDVQIGIRVSKADIDILAALAYEDRTSKSAVIRRLIHEEARRRWMAESFTLAQARA